MPADDDLAAALADAWDRLDRAAGARRRTLGRVALATLNGRGGPALRTVILRSVDPAARRLEIHTDLRSVKVAEIRADPAAALLLYDPGEEVQVRAEGRAEMLPPGPELDAAWTATPGPVRAAYRMPGPPGTPIADPALPPPSTGWTEEGRENFAAIVLTVDRIDWVRLVPGADRRAAFDWTGGGLQASWLIP
ncbi:pyridoxamine 5'-phosphate oxidase family protein [Inquilinus limosus]|uniref:pyridoxamine 5'-phosphate oxidase family protein n=1 Tax=Inquilinus limosus TaxID=171674 RepID=UPI00041D0576|nr:pyridoxamine 5'-phosphate oxidase family protein [Inquilinus limosus]